MKRRTRTDGYVLLIVPDYHRADALGQVLEHIFIVEEAMGKPLPRTAEVHHVDEDPGNNAPGNLVVCDDWQRIVAPHLWGNYKRATGFAIADGRGDVIELSASAISSQLQRSRP